MSLFQLLPQQQAAEPSAGQLALPVLLGLAGHSGGLALCCRRTLGDAADFLDTQVLQLSLVLDNGCYIGLTGASLLLPVKRA